MTAKNLKKISSMPANDFKFILCKYYLLQIELNESLNSDSPIIRIF